MGQQERLRIVKVVVFFGRAMRAGCRKIIIGKGKIMTHHMRDTANKRWIRSTPVKPEARELVLAIVFFVLVMIFNATFYTSIPW